MQRCLNITREQMGTVAFVSTYPTHQLSCYQGCCAQPGLVCGRSGMAHRPSCLPGSHRGGF